jgi:hypothetical protein
VCRKVASGRDGERQEKPTAAQTSLPYCAERPERPGHGHRQALGVGQSVYRLCRRYELQGDAKFVVTGIASAYLLPAMKINALRAGFVIPAQPVMALKPPSGPDWVHEIKHDGYRIVVHRDGPIVRLYSRNTNDWTDCGRCRADQSQELHD